MHSTKRILTLMKEAKLLLIASILCASSAFAQSELPVQVQADVLKTRIVEAVSQQRMEAVLSLVESVLETARTHYSPRTALCRSQSR